MVDTAKRWYEALGFPREFDAEFSLILNRVKDVRVPRDDAKQFLIQKGDLGLNLVYFLSLCDSVKENFDARGIEEKYFYELISIIKEEALATRAEFGELGIYEVGWMCVVLAKDSLFRIGCLDFQLFRGADWFPLELEEGEMALNVHIRASKRLDVDACLASMEEAKSFMQRHFPELAFTRFVCYSWLLWRGLDAFVGENSNIVRFRKLFEPIGETQRDDALIFVFSKSTTRENIAEFEAKTSLQRGLKAHVLSGGRLSVGYGVRKIR